jgi:uncharacterized protein (DUF305 family)
MSVSRRAVVTVALSAVLLGGAAAAAAQAVPMDGPTDPSAQSQPSPVQTTTTMPIPTSATAFQFGATLAGLEGRDLETTFLAEIIPHHGAAITMAQLELERGVDDDIRTHAEDIIANQRHQIDQFTRWLREWYQLTPEQAMAQAPEQARQQMAALERETQQMIAELRNVAAGAEFDIAFVQRMIPHHQAGIVEFLEPQSRAPHAQLRVAAASGINTQTAQVADFRTWLSAR